jgi:hypothetical protein
MGTKSFFENISSIKENIGLYIEKKISLYTLIGFEKAAKGLSTAISISTVIVFMIMALFFLSAAAAIYIGKLLEAIELGLLVVGGFYIFLGIIFFLFRKQIFSSLIITFLADVFFKNDDDENENADSKNS